VDMSAEASVAMLGRVLTLTCASGCRVLYCCVVMKMCVGTAECGGDVDDVHVVDVRRPPRWRALRHAGRPTCGMCTVELYRPLSTTGGSVWSSSVLRPDYVTPSWPPSPLDRSAVRLSLALAAQCRVPGELRRLCVALRGRPLRQRLLQRPACASIRCTTPSAAQTTPSASPPHPATR
jgi:hypothetical protein